MRAHLSRRYTLSASHRLHNEDFSDEQNAQVYGKCNNPHGHGHNYIIEVTVAGQVDKVTGMVVNMVELDRCVRRAVIEPLDHTNLNRYAGFKGAVPTTENLCIAIHGLLQHSLEAGELVSVRIEETRNNFFEYTGEASPARPSAGLPQTSAGKQVAGD